MSELPEGWASCPLEDVLSGVIDFRGRTPKKLGVDWGGDIPALSALNVRNGGIDHSRTVHFGSDALYQKWMTNGDAEYGDTLMTTEAPMGKVAQIPDDRRYILSQRVVLLKPNSAVQDRNYLARMLGGPQFQASLQENATGTTVKGIRRLTLVKLPVDVPPLNEQKRIVQKIDALTEKSREAREALDEVPQLLDKLRQSILAAAFRGDLTKKWREQNPDFEPASVLLHRIRQERRARWEEAELAKMRAKGKEPKNDKWKAKYKEPKPVDTEGLPELPEGWCWASLGELLAGIEAGKSPSAAGEPAKGHEYGVLKVSAVSWGRFLPKENKRLPEGFIPPSKITVRKGDLLISRANTAELVGAVVLVEEDHPKLMLCDKTLRLVPASSEVLKGLLLHSLRTRWVRDVFEDDATGTSDSMRNLSQGKILSAPVALPPADEQKELLMLLTQGARMVSELGGSLKPLAEAIQDVDASILAKAFRGELVPQDPNDEPASVLLERIRAEREATGGGKKRKQNRGKNG